MRGFTANAVGELGLVVDAGIFAMEDFFNNDAQTLKGISDPVKVCTFDSISYLYLADHVAKCCRGPDGYAQSWIFAW